VIPFLSGALTLSFLIASMYFVRFWRRTGDRLFLAFAFAFALFALNQFVVFLLGATDERTLYAYILRVIGFVLILSAIVDKNVSPRSGPRSGDKR